MSGKCNSFDLSFKADIEETKILVGNFHVTVKRAGSSNKAYTKAFQHFQQCNSRKIKHDLMSDKEANNLLAEILVNTVITDWDGVKEKEGDGEWKEVKFTKKGCLEMLKLYPDAMNIILREAQDIENFKREEAEEISKK